MKKREEPPLLLPSPVPVETWAQVLTVMISGDHLADRPRPFLVIRFSVDDFSVGLLPATANCARVMLHKRSHSAIVCEMKSDWVDEKIARPFTV
jgi:hypothetical protein